MRKGILFFISFLFFLSKINAQTAQGTITPGSTATSVYVKFQPSSTISNGSIGVQFAVAFPTSLPTLPTSVTATSLITGMTLFLQTGTYTEQAGYRIFTFTPPANGNSANYAGGQIYNIAELTFSGTGFTAVPASTTLLQLANGGTAPNNFVYFYITNNGFDITNVPAQFFTVTMGAVIQGGTSDYSANASVTKGSGVLPIIISSFNAVKKENNTLLTWTVVNQDANADHFVIERSLDGINFTTLSTQPVSLIGGTRIEYSYIDANLSATKNNGVIYYRLRSYDKDGSFVISEIKNVKITNTNTLPGASVYPNPAKSFTTLKFELTEAAKVSINITDASGKTVNNIEYNGTKGVNQKQIELGSYSAGMYTLKIQTGTQLQTINVMKTN